MDNLLLSIQRIQKILNDSSIPSIVIGGIAIAAWGEPRLTRDVDLKILLSREETELLLGILETGYKMLIANPGEALRKQGLVFIQDDLGTRLDLMLADTLFDRLAIQRGRDFDIQPGIPIRVCSPEDLIIFKLISTRLRDHEDASSVIQRQGYALDNPYVIHWLEQFEQALNDSTLVDEYRRLSKRYKKR
jgi:hypothetical protein